MSKQYVCHISGQGETWEVKKEWEDGWHARTSGETYFLPKSEYRLCEPPEVWVDVTEDCVERDGELFYKDERVFWVDGYRPGKVLRDLPQGSTDRWAFIIKKKVSR